MKANESMLESIAGKFGQIYIRDDQHRSEFLIKVKEIYQEYMSKWGNS